MCDFGIMPGLIAESREYFAGAGDPNSGANRRKA